ncbi:hypothetical protein [Amycolatopsis sp. NPDC059657]|uniref:hypothetical protein n=1 Tax=Amycolatopsis sp. NPDC059657 TaxID=3346899 RepID=UPI00367321C2
MVAPVVGTPEAPLPWGGGELVVEWRGPHALIRRNDESAREADIVSTVHGVPGNFLILASPGAHREPTLLSTIRGCLASLWSLPAESRPRAAWLAVSDLGDPEGDCANWVYGLAAEAGIEIFAPHGAVQALIGTGTYVDRAAGGTGWRRFAPGRAPDVVGCRFPMPFWEHRLPHIPLRAAGLVAEPIPAGLAVNAEGLVPRGHQDLAFRVPANPRIPKIVLGGPGADLPAAAVAELLTLLPPDLLPELLLVPGAAPMTRPEWTRELAGLTGHPVAVSTGSQIVNARRGTRTVVLGARGEELLAPFATIVLQRPDAELPEVVDVAAAPLGWAWAGPRTYQPVLDPNQATPAFPGVVVEVVPGGLAVYTSENSAVPMPFDPVRWTLGVGTPGEAVTDVEMAAVRSLLNGLTTQQRLTACVRVFGSLAPPVQAMLDTYVSAVGAMPYTTVTPEPRAVSVPVPVAPPVAQPVVPPVAVVQPPVPPVLPPPPVAVTSVPVATVSGPGSVAPSRAPIPPQAPVPEPAPPEPLPVPSEVVEEPVPEPLPVPPIPSVQPLAAAQLPGPPVRSGPVQPIVAADRSSTVGEQARLSDSAGSRYTEALATVNVALSTWPMLRPEAKADYIAVCLYLGTGEGGAVPLNAALSTGEPVVFDGYLPCLISGLRRLPTHRQVVLRQENLGTDVECPFPEGAVLVEPAFLSASARLDVTTSAASLDVLIWPVSARRTSELVMGRSIDEAVFPPGRRFKVLAVETDTGEPADGEEPDGPRTPRTALLARELLTGEDPHSVDAAARDTAALARLERALATRRAADARLVDDPDVVARLTTPLTVAAEGGQAAGASAGGSLELVS